MNPNTIFLKDYCAPDYLIDNIDLYFDLREAHTLVTSRLKIRKSASASDQTPLILDGQELELIELKVNDQVVASDGFQVDSEHLTIPNMPDACELTITTRIYPHKNTSLEGLYKSGDTYCTQCEAEGFRKITYFLDRPDVMSRFTTTIEADTKTYPVLLSNGNPVANGETDEGRSWVRWEDPFHKPAYLFAMVAGDLASIEDSFTTMSDRKITLQIYTEHANIDKVDYAMASLKRAMKWDEDVFGLEYDLDMFMIVATDDFNMGAMENKGLNVFNSKYVLASAETATDTDYQGIEGVIGHEYFHNWTGNRVTCRDWFQLSLKEGLTVFRDQEFSSDMTARSVQRITDVNILRSGQFQEDAGPMSHSVRPDSYEEISNFYTMTVYNKGAEVVRMYHTLLGSAGFRRAMDLYFERHDGQAVTTDDFLSAMSDANDYDLSQFQRWYEQAGTPRLSIKSSFSAEDKTFALHVTQSCPDTPGQSDKKPFLIPFAVGLLDRDGNDMPLTLQGDANSSTETTRILELTQEVESFIFENVDHPPVPSLLRNFSAPVQLAYEHSDEDLAFLVSNDSDSFNRWDSGQQLGLRTIRALIAQQHDHTHNVDPSILVNALGSVLANAKTDPALAALAMVLPGEGYIGEQMTIIDVHGVHQARMDLKKRIASDLSTDLLSTYEECLASEPYQPSAEDAGKRALRNVCLAYLSELDGEDQITRCVDQFKQATNMTDALGALNVLANIDCEARTEVLSAFYERWKDQPLVVDKWLTLQASSYLPDTFEHMTRLTKHEAFSITNPNKVRSLLGAFAHRNPTQFHREDGRGYEFIADRVLELDDINPQVAARLVSALSRWRRYPANAQDQMRAQLERIVSYSDLSRDVSEIVNKSL